MAFGRERWLGYIMILPVVLAVVGFVLGPAYDVIRLSFTRYVMGQEMGFGTLANFKALLADPLVPLVLRNTALWIFGGTVGCLVLGLLIASFLAIESRTTTVLRAIILLPWILPDVVTAMAWKWMLHGQVGVVGQTVKQLGLTDRPLSLLGDPNAVMWVLTGVVIWRKVPLITLVLTAAIRNVPKDLTEASRMDGATPFETFRYVVLPYISFPLVSMTVISMIWITAEFTLPWVMTGGGPANASHIMSTYIYQQSFEFFNWGVGAAMSVVNLVALLLLVGLYLFIVRKSWVSQERSL
jgi:multiple sugar transport system permease protein